MEIREYSGNRYPRSGPISHSVPPAVGRVLNSNIPLTGLYRDDVVQAWKSSTAQFSQDHGASDGWNEAGLGFGYSHGKAHERCLPRAGCGMQTIERFIDAMQRFQALR